MRRCTDQGYVVLSPSGDVVGVGFDTIGATTDARWRLNNRDWVDMVKAGYRCVPAKVSATFDPKAAA